MPKIHDVQTFLYTMSGDVTIEQNLNDVFENIKLMVGSRAKQGNEFDFQIRLDLKMTKEEEADVKDLTNSIIKVFKDGEKIEKSELLPVAVDGHGDPVYKRREDIQKEKKK
jgi:hypothetical protein